MRPSSIAFIALALFSSFGSIARAASLPEHDSIDVLIIGDRVNPHGLPPELLTEPHDLATALRRPDNGIDIASVHEVDSACIDAALELMRSGSVDVMIYFAHRPATGCDETDLQPALTEAAQKFLENRGGILVFHHGIYHEPGKDEMLALLGGRADEIAWDTDVGQNVIATARDHFITTNHLSYDRRLEFSAVALGVGPDLHPSFTNTPDERYPELRLLEAVGETRTILFASDYAGPQILSYDLHRPGWQGHVVLYQPGEYKPHALDDIEGHNFQILVNAIHYLATVRETPSHSPTHTTHTNDSEGSSDDAEDPVAATTGHDPIAEIPTDELPGAGADLGDPQCSVAEKPKSIPWFVLALFLPVAVVTIPRRRRSSSTRPSRPAVVSSAISSRSNNPGKHAAHAIPG